MFEICPTSPDVNQCAEAICDQHIPNQLRIVANTLAYALEKHDIVSSEYGKAEDADETVGEWAAEEWDNFMWLSFYGMALAEESDLRFGVLSPAVSQILSSGRVGSLMVEKPESYACPESWFRVSATKADTDLFEGHRKHILRRYAAMAEEGHPPSWTGVNPPRWVLKHAR